MKIIFVSFVPGKGMGWIIWLRIGICECGDEHPGFMKCGKSPTS
jgi:hypothetical protein